MDYRSSNKKFKSAVCGGTFDHFHKGHESFIEHGLSISKELIIGITSDEYIKKIKIKKLKLKIEIQNSEFENYSLRKKSLENFLKRIEKDRYEILKIDDLFGTTLDKDFQADAILVSESTKPGAEEINRERFKRDLSQFKIIIVPQVLAEDKQPISSFRIRNGEINREGRLNINPAWFKNTLFLPQDLRSELKKPLGKLIEKIDKEKITNCAYLITVGDETTKVFNSAFIKPDISIVDLKVARVKKFSNLKELGFSGKEKTIKIKNPSGCITFELFKTIFGIFKKRQNNDHLIIKIDGEDDLSVLPLILSAPLGSCIFYGQPDQARLPSPHSEASGRQGIVQITVDEKTKNKVHKIMDRFNTRGY